MLAPSQPNIAINSCSLAPASAARTAPILRKPWQLHCGSPAFTHQLLNLLPKLFELCGLPEAVSNQVSSKRVCVEDRAKWRQDRKREYLDPLLPPLELGKGDRQPIPALVLFADQDGVRA